jgi:outer membrane protein OmpA-like peptidoglycan-associated protein
VGDYYKHTDSTMKARTIYKEIENNGIKFQEYTHNSPPDENGDYTFVKIWVTLNEETNQYVFWGGSTNIKKKTPQEDRSKEIIAILQSITKFTKTVQYEDRALKPNESIDLTIMFLPDETDIEAESKKELKKIKKFLKDNPNIDVTIIGYASKINPENRASLGKARAQKVMREFIDAKIDKARLQAEGSNEAGKDKIVKIVIDQIR